MSATPRAVSPLHTERLRLRELVADDAGFLVELLNDADFIARIGDRGVRTAEAALGYLRDGPWASYAEHGFGLWCVERMADGVPLGMCGLLKRATLPDIDIGYAFLPRFRGQGYAREAARAVLEFADDALCAACVLAVVAPGNTASTALLADLEFAREGDVRLVAGGEMLELWARRR